MALSEEDISLEELQANLDTYKEQLHQVNQLLAADPGNAEYREIRQNLKEVIELTQELFSAQQAEAGGGVESRPNRESQQNSGPNEQILDGFPVGSKIQAVWSEDGEWYDGTIDAITANGYIVAYEGWGNKEEVDFANVRLKAGVGVLADADSQEDSLLEAERQAEATKLAIKQKIAQAAQVDVVRRELPPKLRINPEDPVDIKAAKKRKIHAFKSKLRLEQMEVTQNKRQNAWQQFQCNKGKSKKVGFFTGRKKESIFKSPDDPKGKVGVTGSGKGITEFQKREKHLHLKMEMDEVE